MEKRVEKTKLNEKRGDQSEKKCEICIRRWRGEMAGCRMRLFRQQKDAK